jgi:DNA polymerase-3 subunit gamma/tau
MATTPSYLVTARKWRPMVFEDIIGQEHVTTTLENAITAKRISHAYIFSGQRGCGKTTTARILAKAVNCLHPKGTNPDNECELCREITEGRSVNVFEIDGASNRGVDEIRNLRDAVRYAPQKGKYKVYIIDEVHMLTKEAFNALLKTLEEPPSYVIFIFATTEVHKLPATILSRCQRFDFRRIAANEIVDRLRVIAKAEKITVPDEPLFLIAKRADGSMRDAQSLFDQVIAFCGQKVSSEQILTMLNVVDEEVYFRLSEIIRQRSVKDGLLLVHEIANHGYDIREFLLGLGEHFRNLLVVRTTGATDLIEASDIYKQRYRDEAVRFGEADLLRLMKLASETEASIRWSQHPRLRLEIGISQMIKMDKSVEIDRLLSELEEVKKNLKGTGDDHPRATPQRSAGERPRDDMTPRADDVRPPANQTAPIRGSVDAGALHLRSVRPAVPKKEESSLSLPPDPQAGEPGGDAPVHVPAMSEVDARGKWDSILEAARHKRIAVGTMLSASRFIGFEENRLRIACPDDFHLEGLSLSKNRAFIQEIAESIFGAKIRLEMLLADAERFEQEHPGNPQPGQASSSSQENPVIQALIRELGAQEIG